MYLKAWKDVASEQRPSMRVIMTQVMFGIELVKGAAMDASASLRDIPTSAALNAPQSLAPSPHMPTNSPSAYKDSTNIDLWSGDILAYILARLSMT